MKPAALPPFAVTRMPLPEGRGATGEIFEAAVLENGRAMLPRFRRYGARAVVLVLAVYGEAEYEDETGFRCDLSPGDLILVNPKLGHRYGAKPGSAWSEMYVSFRGPLFDFLEENGLPGGPVGRGGSATRLRKKLRGTLPDGDESQDVCAMRLAAFLTEAFAIRKTAGAAGDWLPTAKRLLEADCPTVAETTSRLAGETGLSPETLRKRFRAETGRSMKAWQMAARVETARTLLARGDMTQKEIAGALGFSHPQHFSRTLKKFTGRPPGRLDGNSRKKHPDSGDTEAV